MFSAERVTTVADTTITAASNEPSVFSRRDIVAGSIGAACAAAFADTASAHAAPAPELEDWIGRKLLARVFESSRRGPKNPGDWDIYWSYVDFRFDDRGQLLATQSFRTSMTACLQDGMPRFFPIEHYNDLQILRALLWEEHPAFRGLAGVPGSTHPYPSNDIWLLVGPPHLLERECATHPEIVRWGRPVSGRHASDDLARSLVDMTG